MPFCTKGKRACENIDIISLTISRRPFQPLWTALKEIYFVIHTSKIEQIMSTSISCYMSKLICLVCNTPNLDLSNTGM